MLRGSDTLAAPLGGSQRLTGALEGVAGARPLQATPTAVTPALAEAPLLAQYARASEGLLAARALDNRVDTKFVVPRGQLEEILVALADAYAVLPIGAGFTSRYRTDYFDTPDLESYHDHRRGRRPRHKVRVRTYLDWGGLYLEVKLKGNDDVTQKFRRPLDRHALLSEDWDFVFAHLPGKERKLELQARTEFSRITLVGLAHEERVTVDLGVRVAGEREEGGLDRVVILEVKQRRFDVYSPAMRAMRSLRLRPLPMSKYCTAIALTRPGERASRFRPTLRAIMRG